MDPQTRPSLATDSQPLPWRDALIVTIPFLAIALVLSGRLSLWLDEILQLVETRGTTTSQLIHLLPRHPGAAPLGYLLQHAVFALAGYSVRLARLPSAVFATGTIFLTALLGSMLSLKKAWLGAALLAIFPLTLRYACESRTYGPALFFSTLATLLFLRLVAQPGWHPAALYSLALAAAVYTQPYTLFVAPAHLLWAIAYRENKLAMWTAAAAAVAVASFLPWYLWTKAVWVSNIEGAGVHFSVSWKTPLMLFRELAGAGYWGSGLLIILFVFAFRAHDRRSQNRVRPSRNGVLLASLIVVPAVLAVLADGFFGYFVATRQIMWVLPAVAILAGLGIETRPRTGYAIASIFTCLCLWQTVKFFTSPRENWQIAADALATEVNQGACLIVVPAEELRSYAFFHPELAASRCPAPRSVLAFTPYTTKLQHDTATASLAADGLSLLSTRDAGKTEVAVYSRKPQ